MASCVTSNHYLLVHQSAFATLELCCGSCHRTTGMKDVNVVLLTRTLTRGWRAGFCSLSIWQGFDLNFWGYSCLVQLFAIAWPQGIWNLLTSSLWKPWVQGSNMHCFIYYLLFIFTVNKHHRHKKSYIKISTCSWNILARGAQSVSLINLTTSVTVHSKGLLSRMSFSSSSCLISYKKIVTLKKATWCGKPCSCTVGMPSSDEKG